MLPETLIRPQKPSRHLHEDFFALLRADRLGAHFRVWVELVAEHHHRDQAPSVLLIVNQLCPAVVAQACAVHEAASPVVALHHAILVFKQQRHVDRTLEQRPGNVIPVPHHEPEDLVCLIDAGEHAGVRYLAAEDFPVVSARHHGLRSRDEGGEEPVEYLDVHRPAAFAVLEEVAEVVKLGVR